VIRRCLVVPLVDDKSAINIEPNSIVATSVERIGFAKPGSLSSIVTVAVRGASRLHRFCIFDAGRNDLNGRKHHAIFQRFNVERRWAWVLIAILAWHGKLSVVGKSW
jgi:hypothetical protein